MCTNTRRPALGSTARSPNRPVHFLLSPFSFIRLSNFSQTIIILWSVCSFVFIGGDSAVNTAAPSPSSTCKIARKKATNLFRLCEGQTSFSTFGFVAIIGWLIRNRYAKSTPYLRWILFAWCIHSHPTWTHTY